MATGQARRQQQSEEQAPGNHPEPISQDAPDTITDKPEINLPEGVSDDLEAAKEKGLVWLYPPKGEPVLGFWRNTRKFVAMRWEPTAFWALWEGLGRLPFEPVGWRPQ